MPYLSFLTINYDIPEISEVMTWFESCIIRSYANPMVEHQIMLEKYTEYKNQFIQALNDMDIDITDYRYDEDSKQLYMKRKLGKKEYELSFTEESDGTRKLIAALPVVLLALREGRLVITFCSALPWMPASISSWGKHPCRTMIWNRSFRNAPHRPP